MSTEAKQEVSRTLLRCSLVQLQLSTFQSCSLMMKHAATKSAAFRQSLNHPRGISFGTGDPNLLMATSGHMAQSHMKAYVLKHGPMEAFMCELVLSYLYQHWETTTRPRLEAIIGQKIKSAIFGDLRLIRNALQHEKHRHLAEAENIKKLEILNWLKEKSEARLTGDAFDAIMYSVSLDLHRLNNTWGNGPSNITALPTFIAGARHFGLKDLNRADIKNLSKVGWYRYYVLEASKSAILKVEKAALGDLHS